MEWWFWWSALDFPKPSHSVLEVPTWESSQTCIWLKADHFSHRIGSADSSQYTPDDSLSKILWGSQIRIFSVSTLQYHFLSAAPKPSLMVSAELLPHLVYLGAHNKALYLWEGRCWNFDLYGSKTPLKF